MIIYHAARECYLKPGEVCHGHLYSDGLDFTTEGTFFFPCLFSDLFQMYNHSKKDGG